MKRLLIPVGLAVLVVSWGIAQDGPAVQSAVPEVKEAAAADDAQQASPLDALEWMVGEWLDQGAESTITTSCSWTMNRRFLSRSFKVTIDNQVTLEGTQMVGWDPIENQLRSWTFDSEGGFGEGRWIQDGDRWLVKASFVLADGARASALNVYTNVDADTFRWQSIDREIAGELQPNIPEVTIIRQQKEKDSQQSEKEESR